MRGCSPVGAALGRVALVVGGLGLRLSTVSASRLLKLSDRRAVASGERDGVDTAARLLSRRPRPLPLRARSRLQREIFLKRVRRFRSRRTRGRRPAGGKARVQVRGASSGSQVFDVNIWPRQPGVIVKPTQQNIMVGMNCDLNWWGG